MKLNYSIAAKTILGPISFQTRFRATLEFFKIIFTLTWNHGFTRSV